MAREELLGQVAPTIQQTVLMDDRLVVVFQHLSHMATNVLFKVLLHGGDVGALAFEELRKVADMNGHALGVRVLVASLETTQKVAFLFSGKCHFQCLGVVWDRRRVVGCPPNAGEAERRKIFCLCLSHLPF